MCQETWWVKYVYSVVSEYGGAPCRDPDTGQGVGVDLVRLNQTQPPLVHVDAPVHAVMDAVLSNYRVRVWTNLNTSQCVAWQWIFMENKNIDVPKEHRLYSKAIYIIIPE